MTHKPFRLPHIYKVSSPLVKGKKRVGMANHFTNKTTPRIQVNHPRYDGNWRSESKRSQITSIDGSARTGCGASLGYLTTPSRSSPRLTKWQISIMRLEYTNHGGHTCAVFGNFLTKSLKGILLICNPCSASGPSTTGSIIVGLSRSISSSPLSQCIIHDL